MILSVITQKPVSTKSAKIHALTRLVVTMLSVKLLFISQNVLASEDIWVTPTQAARDQNALEILIVQQRQHAEMKSVLIHVTVQPMQTVMPETTEDTAHAGQALLVTPILQDVIQVND